MYFTPFMVTFILHSPVIPSLNLMELKWLLSEFLTFKKMCRRTIKNRQRRGSVSAKLLPWYGHWHLLRPPVAPPSIHGAPGVMSACIHIGVWHHNIYFLIMITNIMKKPIIWKDYLKFAFILGWLFCTSINGILLTPPILAVTCTCIFIFFRFDFLFSFFF